MRSNGGKVGDGDRLEIVVSGIIARGGDRFETLLENEFIREYLPLSGLMLAHYCRRGTIAMPRRGRQLDLAAVD